MIPSLLLVVSAICFIALMFSFWYSGDNLTTFHFVMCIIVAATPIVNIFLSLYMLNECVFKIGTIIKGRKK